MQNLIDAIHVKGFRSLADVKIDDLPRVAVLIGANGSGKSNFIRLPRISKRSGTWETITIFMHTAAIWLRFCFSWNVKISNDSRGYVTTLVGCCRSLTVSR